MKHLFICLFLILSLLSCTTQNSDKTSSPVIDSIAVNRDTTLEIKDYLGVYNPRNNTIILCNDSTSIPVIDETKSLDTIIKKLFPNEVQSAQVEVKAIAQPKQFVIKQVSKAEQKNQKNTCIPYDYWCIGTEPFWNIQISRIENLIDFYEPMEQKNYHFEYSEPKNDKGVIIYATKNKTDKIQIKIKQEICSDGMSEKNYKHSAEINLNGNSFKGCAIMYGESTE